MRKFYNADGDVILNSRDGLPAIVASVKNGVTYNFNKGRTQGISKVTIHTMNLMDEFFFDPSSKLVFHHIQSRNISPDLIRCYLNYFAEAEHYNSESFILYVCDNYFKELGYSFQEFNRN